MAWIESHQELRGHPKLARLARLLGVSKPVAIGHLHLLWWWALDHAEDGDLSAYEAADLADACEWEGEPEALVKALISCGPGDTAGFVDEVEGRWVLHNWWQYAGKLVARRQADRERKRSDRAPLSVGTPAEPEEMPNGHPPDGAQTAYVYSDLDSDLNQTSSAVARREDVDSLCDLLVELVVANGCKRPAVTAKWRDEARRLLDRDGASRAEAERVMRWALDDEFWSSNILSMPKFRAKYDQLRLRSRAAPVQPEEEVPWLT